MVCAFWIPGAAAGDTDPGEVVTTPATAVMAVDTTVSIPVAVDSTAMHPSAMAATPSDSTSSLASQPAGPLATRADSVAFRSVSRRVKPDGHARAMSQGDTLNVQGRHISVRGVQHPGKPESTLAWTDITKVERLGSASDRGALVGGIVFGALGMIVAATEAGGPSSHSTGADVAASTIGGAAIGALLGAVVASPFTRWKNVALDSPEGGGWFNDSRRGFVLELGAGPGFTNSSNVFSDTVDGTEFGAFTRIRVGYGFSERYAVAYVGDGLWHGDITGIDGVGLSLFSAPGTPSWTVELAGGSASTGETDGDNSKSNFGLQGCIGYEFSKHWLARASLMHTSFGDENHTVIGTSIGHMWY